MTEAQFNSAIAIYNPNGGHRTGKIYDVTPNANDLTVTGGGGTRINKAGQVEVVAGHAPKIDYRTGKPAFLIEPTRTNNELYSYDPITNGNWTLVNNLTATLNQVGITGESSTAVLLTDSSTGSAGEYDRGIYTASSIILKSSIWIKKDTDQTRFPEIYISYRKASDGTFMETLFQLNTETGEFVYRNGLNGNTCDVIDRGSWWEIVIISGATTNRIQYFKIRPAVGSTLGTYSVSPTGSIVVGHIGIYNSSVVNETPIITNGSAVTRTESVVSIPVPSGVTEIEEVVDGTTNLITNIPTTYQMPQGAVESVIFR